ncbi:MAG: hypothetical protein U0796_05040 [Gemmatales bacterium]
MPRITCLHGHEIEIEPEQYGQRLACPACQLMMVVSPPRPGEPSIPKYEVKCDNGHVLRVKAKYLGTQIRCPQCQGLAWVTTDRLLCHTPLAPTPTVAPVPMPRRQLPLPPVVKAPVVTEASPVVTPVVATLQDIPIAEVDETADLPVAMADDDDDEANDGKLTKAERRSMNFVDLGLSIFTGSVICFYCLRMVSLVFIMILVLLAQATSGGRAMATFFEVVMWIIIIAFLINYVVYLFSNILLLFTPLKTGATLWFILGLLTIVALLSWSIYSAFQTGWRPRFTMHTDITGLTAMLIYIGNLLAVYVAWLCIMIGLWQLGKFARKPMTRQRVIMLCLFTLVSEIVLGGFPLLLGITAGSMVSFWVIIIIYTLLTVAAGAFLSLQHMIVVGEVRAVMVRRK